MEARSGTDELDSSVTNLGEIFLCDFQLSRTQFHVIPPKQPCHPILVLLASNKGSAPLKLVNVGGSNWLSIFPDLAVIGVLFSFLKAVNNHATSFHILFFVLALSVDGT